MIYTDIIEHCMGSEGNECYARKDILFADSKSN
jgi:hypothetical protein